MRYRVIAALVATVLLNEAGAEPRKPFTVADSIAMTRLVDPQSSPWAEFKFSPDGNKFSVVTMRGNLTTGLNEYTLAVFDAKEVLGFVNKPERKELPKAALQVRFETSSPERAIDQVQWLADGRGLVFIERGIDGVGQVYELDLKTSRVRQLTHHLDNIETFWLSADAQVLVYSARTPPDWEERNRRGYVVRSETIDYLTTADPRTVSENRYFIRDLRTGKVTNANLPPEVRAGEVFVAPSGRWAIVESQVQHPPVHWFAYEHLARNLDDLKTTALEIEEDNPFVTFGLSLRQFQLIDLTSGAARPLLDAPKETSISWSGWSVMWSPDSKHVIVPNTYLPRSVSQVAGFQNCRSIVEVDIETIQVTPLACVEAVRGRNGSQVLRRVIEYPSNDSILIEENEYKKGAKQPVRARQLYRRQGNTWIKSNLPAELGVTPPATLQLAVVQDMNTPPEIEATDHVTGRKRIITKLNPQLDQLALGRVETFQFSDRLHREFTAGLVLPPDFQKGRRYPVVIQTYGFSPDRFSVSGPPGSGGAATAFAARALANKGILVLQVGCSPGEAPADGPFEDSGENPRSMACFEGAIDALDEQGLIDRGRVGLVGFSRTGMHVHYAVTFSRYPVAAVTIADSTQATPWAYVLAYGGNFPGMLQWDTHIDWLKALIGAPFWGDGIKLWAERSPAFHLHRIRTPIRCETIGTGYPPGCWDTFVILKRQRRPIELIHIPKDEHNLRTPFGLFTSSQGNVDWFTFWLKGEEDSDPTKAEQYQRWRVLRRQQERHLTELRANGADSALLPTLPRLQSARQD